MKALKKHFQTWRPYLIVKWSAVLILFIAQVPLFILFYDWKMIRDKCDTLECMPAIMFLQVNMDSIAFFIGLSMICLLLISSSAQLIRKESRK